MRRSYLPMVHLLLAALLAGCGADYNARQIVEHNTLSGKVFEDMAGTGQKLIERGDIDAHRRYKMPDKTDIDVWVLHARQRRPSKPDPAKGTVIILHGLSESKASFPYRGSGTRLAKMGYDVVLPDLRAHGRSGGRYVTFGAKEKYDVKAVIDALLGEGQIHEPIYAFGATLGATIAIQYAAIDPRCKGVMVMTPYRDATTFARRRLLMLSEEDFQAALDQAGKLADFDPAEASAVEAAKKLSIPLLLVHGMIDLSVPAENSQAIYDAAAGPKKLTLVIPGETVALFAVMEDWIADRMDTLIKTGLKEEKPE